MIEAAVDDIGADIRAAMADPVAESPVVEVAEVEAEAAPQETPAEARARDETGRFAKGAKEVQAAPASPVVAEPPQEAIRPPATWSATAKAEFSKLPPIVQQEVLKREKDIDNGRAQWDQKGERLNKIDAFMAPHRDRLALAGTDEISFLGALVKADEMLRTNPQQAIVQIAAMYGLNLGQPGAQQPQGAPALQTPEAIQQIVDQQVQAALAKRSEEQERATYASEWETFRTSPEHPYAENVKQAMAALLRQDQAPDLKTAYDMACWANPEVRTLLLAQHAKPQVASPSSPAGLSVTGARSNGQIAHIAASSNASIEDDVRAAMQEVSGRA